MSEKMLNIATDFTDYPAGRFPEDGEFSGERFREEFLIPALRNYDVVKVKLDGVRSFGSSFLDEAFGGLFRLNEFENLADRIIIIADSAPYKFYKGIIDSYLSGVE